MNRRHIPEPWDFLNERAIPVPETGCWLWTGKTDANGYGRIRDGGKEAYAHRFVFNLFSAEPLAAGVYACHRCDVRSCVNPHHIFAGTHADNMRDAAHKRRLPRGKRHWSVRNPAAHPRGADFKSAKLTDADVLFLRNSDLSSYKIGQMLGVSSSLVRRIRRNETWRHVA